MQDLYRYFRITNLRAYVHTGQTTTVVNILAYHPGVVATDPVNIQDFEFDNMVSWTGSGTARTAFRPPVLQVGRGDLSGLLPWYYTEGQGDPEADTVGTLFFWGDDLGTSSVYFAIDMDVEFKDAVDPDVTLQRRAKRDAGHLYKTFAKMVSVE
jgi:hypothetical protein